MKNLLTVLASLGVVSSSSFAATILTSDGNGADSYVRQGQATNNFGNATNIVLKGGNGSTTRKGYLRFDLSATTQPVLGASLTLTVATNNSGGPAPVNGQTFNVDIYGLTNEALDNWVEGNGGVDNLPANEITYANAPANANPGNNFNGDATLLGTLNIPGTLAGQTITFSDPALVTFLNSDTNGSVSILMRRQLGGSSNLAFSSKEGASAPALIVAIPEPTAFAMCFIAAGAGLLRRKRS